MDGQTHVFYESARYAFGVVAVALLLPGLALLAAPLSKNARNEIYFAVAFGLWLVYFPARDAIKVYRTPQPLIASDKTTIWCAPWGAALDWKDVADIRLEKGIPFFPRRNSGSGAILSLRPAASGGIIGEEAKQQGHLRCSLERANASDEEVLAVMTADWRASQLAPQSQAATKH